MTLLTHERLLELVRFDPGAGVFTSLADWGRWGRKKAGRVLSVKSVNGYVRVCLPGGQTYLAHRLAWFYMTGAWPELQIDHKNRDRTDNRWENLRQATTSQNSHNAGMPCTNTSGVKGVSWSKQHRKWHAYLKCKEVFGNRRLTLGLFSELRDAAHSVNEARIRYHGEFANTSTQAEKDALRRTGYYSTHQERDDEQAK